MLVLDSLSGYIPAISFLGLIFILLVGLLAMYYCLSKDLCPCAHADQKPDGYEELQLGESNEGMDGDYEDSAVKSIPSPRSPQSDRETFVSEGDVEEQTSKPTVSSYGGDTTGPEYPAMKEFSDIASIRSTGTARGNLANAVYVGKVFVMAEFFPDVGRVGFSIVEAQSIPPKSKGGASHCRFHAVLLPDKKQRFKTKSLKGPNPKFKETYVFDRLQREDLYRLAVRMRLYGQSSVSKEKFIGEMTLQLADIAVVHNHRLETWRDILKPATPGTMTP